MISQMMRIIVTINREKIAIIFSKNDIKDYSDHKITIMKSFDWVTIDHPHLHSISDLVLVVDTQPRKQELFAIWWSEEIKLEETSR